MSSKIDYEREKMIKSIIEIFSKGEITINQMKEEINNVLRKADIELDNMFEVDRIIRLDSLLRELKDNYLQISNGTHNVFEVDPICIYNIINNYNDVLITSDLYINGFNSIGSISQTMRNIKDIYSTNNWLGVSWNYENCERGNFHIKLKDVNKIKVNISCETILSFDFYVNDKDCTMLSFRQIGK